MTGLVHRLATAHVAATAAASATLKEHLNVLNHRCGGGFRIDSANGGQQLEHPSTGKTYTGHIKSPELVRFIAGFIDGYEYAKHPKAEARTSAARYVSVADADSEIEGILSDDDSLDAYVWALMDEEGRAETEDTYFEGQDGCTYCKLTFSQEDKTALLEADDVTNKDIIKSSVGAILVFDAGSDVENDMPTISYYKTTTALDAGWEATDNEAEDEEEVEAPSDEDLDNAVIEIIDAENGPKPTKEAGDETTPEGYSAAYMIGDLLEALGEYGQGFVDAASGYVGVVYNSATEEGADSKQWIVWCPDEAYLEKAFNGEDLE